MLSYQSLHQTSHWVIVGLWGLLIIGVYLTFLLTELTMHEALATLFQWFTVSWWGIGIFLLLYIARPLTLLPMSIFSILSGVFFGFYIGALVVYLGVIISALISYVVGRWLRHTILELATPPISKTMLQQHPFEVITGLHLTMLPFDLINYGAGLLQVPYKPFFGGVLIGLIPGTISLTAFGAAVNLEKLLAGDISWNMFDWRYIGLSVGVFLATLLGSYFWRTRTKLGQVISSPQDETETND